MFGAPERSTGNAGIYLGVVRRIAGDTAYVEVPRLAPRFEYPARFPAELAGTDTLEAGGHDHSSGAGAMSISPAGGHDHAASSSTAGDHQHAATGDHAHSYTDGGVSMTTGTTGSHQHATAGGHTHPVDVEPVGAHTHGIDAGSGSAPDHVHPLRPLAPGDDVAVAFLEGGRDELVVLVRLA